MTRSFICKDRGSNYYLVNEGMGAFLLPSGHPEHDYSIVENRRGHDVSFMSLSSASISDWLPVRVQGRAKRLLKGWVADVPDESWLSSVYNYFQHCYSKDGIDRNLQNCITFGKFWDNAEQEKDMPPTHHLGYLWVKKFYPDHEPDLKRIQSNSPDGQWSTKS